MADKVQRPRRVETFGGDYYKPYATEAYMDQIEAELSDTKRAFMLLAEHEAYTSHGANRVFTKFIEMARDERTGK